ncbi:Uma2 family endonuclease [Streptomyces sp. NPDC005953]|uniref:Uma2 family endonuclease n=1 Tax=Streptomyces sp. NPDC005953 TaxID=3156719 RepID=UPI0033CE9BCD
MSAAAAEHPCDGERGSLLDEADVLAERNPGHRVEIIGGVITVSPLADFAHARALTTAMLPFLMAGFDGTRADVLQAVAMWLPGGPSDYAIPDLAILDADFEEHHVERNCYDPAVFRLVLEVTSSNYQADLRNKVAAYAQAGIPVYVIVDRKHQRLHVLTDPDGTEYGHHRIHAPGEQITLPESIGAEVKLDVEELLKAAERKA